MIMNNKKMLTEDSTDTGQDFIAEGRDDDDSPDYFWGVVEDDIHAIAEEKGMTLTKEEIEHVKRVYGDCSQWNETIGWILDDIVNERTKSKKMALEVFFERDGCADLVAMFTDEQLYAEIIPALNELAKNRGYDHVTEHRLG